MSLLYQALLKASMHSKTCSPTAGAQPRYELRDTPHAAMDPAVAPPHPSAQQPPTKRPSADVQPETKAKERSSSVAQRSPVSSGPSATSLLDEVSRAASLSPTVATLLREVRQSRTMRADSETPLEPSAADLLEEASQVEQIIIDNPSPNEQDKTEDKNIPSSSSETNTTNDVVVGLPDHSLAVALMSDETTQPPPVELNRTVVWRLVDRLRTTAATVIRRIVRCLRPSGACGVGIPAKQSCSRGEDIVAPAAADVTINDNPPATMPTSEEAMAAAPPGETLWRPRLQVDRVIWQGIHNWLQTVSAAAVDQITDHLMSLCASGNKTLGMAAAASGEGVTTMVLAVARNLADQGRRIVLVDANWSNPQLASSLGLLPQFGWEDTLGGNVPLEEVVIESLGDGLAVLPVCRPPACTIAPSEVADSLEILAREFDVVLVDLGPLVDVEPEDAASHTVAARMDAVILVQDVRVTTPSRLAEVRRRLAAANVRLSGTIQNAVG